MVLALALAACSGAAAGPSEPAGATVTAPPPAPATPSPAPPLATSVPIATASPTAEPAPSKSPKALPSIDQAELDAYLTASITLIDLADDDLAVTVSYLDPDSEESIDLGTYALESMEQSTNQVPPGTYRLDFRQPASAATGPTCTIEIGDADNYVFAAVPDAVAVSRTGVKPKDARELFVSTSSLCGK